MRACVLLSVLCLYLPPRPPLTHHTTNINQPPTESEDSSEMQEIPLPNVKNNVLAKVRGPHVVARWIPPIPCVCDDLLTHLPHPCHQIDYRLSSFSGTTRTTP